MLKLRLNHINFDRLAKIISLVFNPILVLPIFSLWLLSSYLTSWVEIGAWAFNQLIVTFGIPLIFVLYLIFPLLHSFAKNDFSTIISKLSAFFDQFYIRQLMLISSAFGSFLIVWVKAEPACPPVLLAANQVLLVILVSLVLINLKLRPSIHCLSITGTMTLLVQLTQSWLLTIWAFLIIPGAAWSRLHLNKHSLTECLLGTTLGLLAAIYFYIIMPPL